MSQKRVCTGSMWQSESILDVGQSIFALVIKRQVGSYPAVSRQLFVKFTT